MLTRNECVFCFGKLEEFLRRDNYPITLSPPPEYNTDVFSNQIFSKCVQCSCVQMSELIDPCILYAGVHNNTANTPTWKDHHQSFCKFIEKSNKSDILEIGGNGILFDKLKDSNPNIHYSCLDICEPTEKIVGIEYLQGNCENYDLSKHKTVVMSHVFEHLFNPRKFVENASASQIESLYISIPHMEAYIDLNIPNFLNNEHTYYLEKQNVEWLFSQYNYELSELNEFKKHSLFMYFKRNMDTPKLTLLNISEKAYKLYSQLNYKFPVCIKPNSFVIPAGSFGQNLYYCTKAKILGFIDNDTSKQNHRVYGTPYNVYSIDILMNYSDITIYLVAGHYNTELKKQIQSLEKNFEIIEL